MTARAHGAVVRLGWSSVCRGNDCAAVARATGACQGAPPLVVVRGQRIRLTLGFAPAALSMMIGSRRHILPARGAVAVRATKLGVLRLTARSTFEAVYTLCLVSRKPAPQAAPMRTTLTGRLVLSPATPVCTVGIPCTKPLAGATLDFSRNGAVVASATTGADGRYSVELAAGTYAVARRASDGPSAGRGLDVQTVVVPAAAVARLDLVYDAGIR